MKRRVLFTLTLIALATASPAADDVRTIIERSMAANVVNWKAAPEYGYFERDLLPGGKSKTYQELMIMGSPYERLVALNDKPLSAEQELREQQKLEAAVAQRQHETEQERAERIAKYEKDRKRDRLFMEQLTKAFDFVLASEEKVDAFDVWVLKATPRPGYRPPSIVAEVLRGMQGTLWIDKKTFQWVKAQAQVIRPVSIEGFLARVEPGTGFELELRPVEGGVWLPSHFAMKSRVKVLFVFPRNSQIDETYYGYGKNAPVQP